MQSPTVEAWIMVEAWDDQTGGWYTVDEATTVDSAHRMICEYRIDNAENGEVRRYRIVETRTTEING